MLASLYCTTRVMHKYDYVFLVAPQYLMIPKSTKTNSLVMRVNKNKCTWYQKYYSYNQHCYCYMKFIMFRQANLKHSFLFWIQYLYPWVAKCWPTWHGAEALSSHNLHRIISPFKLLLLICSYTCEIVRTSTRIPSWAKASWLLLPCWKLPCIIA